MDSTGDDHQTTRRSSTLAGADRDVDGVPPNGLSIQVS